MLRFLPESWLESTWFALLSGPVLVLLPIVHAIDDRAGLQLSHQVAASS